ncbi:DUF1214 domain-containing protein [Bartonella sp. A05]|uniref:DUF1214 domain-containing protein n=1 Tax=Bartonella sp. A05 TaxID=2967261 RepID=UPI0022A99C1D|nr:DUF1214 domain-containing protein [Bartonella sp. A05]MCZ2203855.1 DUF1214 domain-containing protein [Bartonella sp. A05]
MFRYIVALFLIFAVSILCGTLSVYYTLNSFESFGRLKIGKWSTYPQVGTTETDPYTRARTAKRGAISLDRTESLSFQIWKDNHGHPLRPHCHYLFKGHIPETRLFTLYTVDKFLKPYTSIEAVPFELHTNNVIYENDGSVRIHISSTPQINNWLAITSKKEFGLILTLYATTIISTTALQKPTLPSVEKISGQKNCD